MTPSIELRVRGLVAEHLGVGTEDLGSGVSLREDLAADSLDVLGLAMALEREFGIAMPDELFDHVRTYGDLVHTTDLLLRARFETKAHAVTRDLVRPFVPAAALP